jgi:beta-glucosidase
VRTAINAGIDMVMVPDNYRAFQTTLRNEVLAGNVPSSRIDDAVGRILTKKFELGLFELPFTDRTYTATVGSAAHRALARQAVRESVTLLKNDGGILPLPTAGKRIFVAGKNANDIGNQSGGWTISWQGSSGNITPGTSILEGIRQAVAPGTVVDYDASGRGAAGHDVAIAVLGERPYAEGAGDRTDGMGLDRADLNTLTTLKRSGVPVVVVLVSGRPLVVTEQLPDWQALVVAWLPGTEGQGIADVLFGSAKPTGKLPQSWPRSAAQIPVNVGDASYDPLFPYGHGLTYP